MTLMQAAVDKIALLPEENIRIVLAMVDEMLRQNGNEISLNKNNKTSGKKRFFGSNVDINDYAGSAGKLFGSIDRVDEYIKEMRSDERF
ncbi:MAG: hypothetical protein J6O04_10035 [Selenomonadaceae bacterium]|nr:hypothetical protein [Selenomonadaceae bacterium]